MKTEFDSFHLISADVNKICDNLETIECVFNESLAASYIEQRLYEKCKCHELCEQTTYSPSVSTAYYPAQHALNDIRNKYNVTEEFIKYVSHRDRCAVCVCATPTDLESRPPTTRLTVV